MGVLFKGHHFDREIIILCIRWYLRFKLSFRDLVEMMAERGVSFGPHDDHALDSALCSGIRKTLESRFVRQVGTPGVLPILT